MRRILVVIDNKRQYEKIQLIIKEKSGNDLSFDFWHSNVHTDIWEHPDFKNQNKVVDVKEETDWIVENYDLVISVHCYQFFPANLVNNIRCINIHPGYNPINRGWYPQVFAIINDLPIGATIHEMDEKLDNGPIICRKFVKKYPWDTSLSIYDRVLDAEMELFHGNFYEIFDNSYTPEKPEKGGNFFSKKDFYNHCEINLNEIVTFKDAIDRLRALTHGDYNNAFFKVEKSNEKIYLHLNLIREHEIK